MSTAQKLGHVTGVVIAHTILFPFIWLLVKYEVLKFKVSYAHKRMTSDQ